ncbi:uncharacterized protein N7469_009203 [Penicillium citrinum]|uniref:DUF4187 domain-containing protein n=1 Tax=Penicillium citrinum TaxID=5077 RepID=A0A9W9THK8_PENCI|nr:uncharacterized protein N7469_009203 [Penicillium citrinum]KAJ5222963.1 hypothetical protein N7469_009203 [Penicillium citrinum]
MDSFDERMSPGRPRDGDSFSGRASGDYRRRSPSPQDRRRRRPRSRSPLIDRYEPSDRRPRDSFYPGPREGRPRERRRSPFSSRDSYTPGNRNRSPPIVYPDPLSVDFELELKEFRLWWRQNQDSIKSSNGIKGEREAWEDREKEEAQLEKDYKDYLIKFTRAFVKKHRDDEWFKERYNDELRNSFRERLLAFRKEGFEQWQRDLSEGGFDDFSLEGIHKSEHDGAGGVIEKEEGETTTAGETQGGQDLVPARGADLRDETLSQPTLLIKTLAPNISREKVEEFLKEHLGEGDGGLKWLSLADPKPKKKFHRMGWIILHPAADASNVVERGDGRDEEGDTNIEMDDETKLNNNIVANTAQRALEAVNEKKIHDPVHGDFTCHMGVHNPPPLSKKTLWDLYSAPRRIEADLSLAQRLTEKMDQELADVLGYDANAVSKIEERVEDLNRKGWLQPPVTGPVSVKQDTGFDEDAEDGELEEGEEKEQRNDVDDMDLLVKKKKLDLLVEYLRRVHNFCFYCVHESDSVHGLTQKCQGHLRRPRGTLSRRAEEVADASVNGVEFPTAEEEVQDDGESSPVQERRQPRNASKNEKQLQTAFKHVKRFEDRLSLILDPETVDLRKFNCVDEEEATIDELLSHHVLKRIVNTDEGKQVRFDCKLPDCSKKFAAERFWLNHTTGRGAEGQPPKNPGHQAFRANIKSEMELVKKFATDPSRLTIPRPDPKKNEENPFGPGGPSHGHGLPMAYTYNPDVPGFAFRGMPPMMSRNGASWGNGVVAGDGLHHPGAMRRGNTRHNTRPGPYDRRRPNGNGRLSPVRMSNMYGAGGRYPPSGHPAAGMVGPNSFPDAMGAGGGQPMPPREAIQGRSIKSYEDLDAVDGSGSGELNY